MKSIRTCLTSRSTARDEAPVPSSPPTRTTTGAFWDSPSTTDASIRVPFCERPMSRRSAAMQWRRSQGDNRRAIVKYRTRKLSTYPLGVSL